MNRQMMVTQIEREIAAQLPSLKVWQRRGLSMLIWGLLALGQAQLSKIAEGASEAGSYNTVRQRVKRWISHPSLWLCVVGEDWVRWVWRSYGGRRAVLLVDETKLGERFGVVMVSLAYGGRAIPLWWRCYRANEAGAYPAQGQVLLIDGLLGHVLSALPEGARPLVQMDRGLGHSSAMLRALNKLGIAYLVRIKSSARFTSRTGCSQLVRHWLQRGHSSCVSGTLFTRQHACTGTLCLLWSSEYAEGWCLFTNLRCCAPQRYAQRWWQEESFRDLKSGGWLWESSHLTCPDRMERLVLVMAIAYAFAISSGVLLHHLPRSVRALTATADQLVHVSLFHLGLRHLRRVFTDCAPLVPFALSFPPPTFLRRI